MMFLLFKKSLSGCDSILMTKSCQNIEAGMARNLLRKQKFEAENGIIFSGTKADEPRSEKSKCHQNRCFGDTLIFVLCREKFIFQPAS